MHEVFFPVGFHGCASHRKLFINYLPLNLEQERQCQVIRKVKLKLTAYALK